MKKGTTVLVFLSVLFQLAAMGTATGEESFWDSLRRKMETVTPAKKGASTAAVGGVRGAKSEGISDLYWKGKTQPIELDEEEIRAFNLALQAALIGEKEESLRLFEDFLANYPESPLKEDVTLAIAQLSSQP